MKTNRAKKLKWIQLFSAVTILSLLFFILTRLDAQLDVQSLFESLRQIPAWSVALIFALQIVSQLLINIQWYQIAKSFGSPIGFFEMLNINAGAEIIHVFPAGHVGCDVYRAVQINCVGNITTEQSVSIVAIQKLFSLSSFFIISLISMSFFIRQVPWLQDTSLQLLLFGLLLFALLAIGCMFVIPHQMASYLRKKTEKKTSFSLVSKLRAFAITSLEHIIYLRKNTKLMARLIALALSIWLLFPLKLYLLAVQLMPEINILYISAATFLSYTVAMIPIFPSGLGGFEATMTGLLLLFGFAQSNALVISIVFRFATFWFVVGLSFVYMAVYKLVKKSTTNLPCESSSPHISPKSEPKSKV